MTALILTDGKDTTMPNPVSRVERFQSGWARLSQTGFGEGIGEGAECLDGDMTQRSEIPIGSQRFTATAPSCLIFMHDRRCRASALDATLSCSVCIPKQVMCRMQEYHPYMHSRATKHKVNMRCREIAQTKYVF